jgi:hypothetical protein
MDSIAQNAAAKPFIKKRANNLKTEYIKKLQAISSAEEKNSSDPQKALNEALDAVIRRNAKNDSW